MTNKTLDELLLECADQSILKAAILELRAQRNIWCELANGPECGESIAEDDQALKLILE